MPRRKAIRVSDKKDHDLDTSQGLRAYARLDLDEAEIDLSLIATARPFLRGCLSPEHIAAFGARDAPGNVTNVAKSASGTRELSA